ncbi:sensor histidine kinase [Granulicoccus phenolivorans]|uniref:sensor histidine kinase n=1 Tax=Granulicoccus phenolivorans TaxID=266854 RepID=UPI000684EB31|nr:HAMP domain-containing sensor histidine kinase [Granulicoccus phenolivorans]
MPLALRRRSLWDSVAVRVLAAVSLLSLLSLLLAGVTGYTLERQRIDEEANDQLVRRSQTFRDVAVRGIDPSTGTSLSNVEDLLYAALQNTVPNQGESMFAIIDGKVALTAPPAVTVRAENDPELVEHVLVLAHQDQTVIDSYRTRGNNWRFVVVPVATPDGGQRGAYVTAYDMNLLHNTLNRNYATIALVGLAAIVVVGLASWMVIGRLLEPIRWVRTTANEITETDLSRRIPVRGNDELALLTRTVNAMLDRLENTFTQQREFYDDIGHELRTPLTVMRGHLELLDVDDPEEVIATRDLALSEIHRMSRLVEDMITLAKVGRADFLTRVEVEVPQLCDEVLEKARMFGDRKWRLGHMDEATTLADPQRISQALLEVCRNAVKYSEPGSSITLGCARVGDQVHIWVRDEGRGIPADQLDAVRRRSVRHASVGIEGSGLGLAIVQSIAQAHDGELLLESEPGHGTTVTLALPRVDLADSDTTEPEPEPKEDPVHAQDPDR